MSDDEFLIAFEARTLTRSQWTHEAHVRMAWLYLTRYPFPQALERVRSGIQQLNATFSLMEQTRHSQHSCRLPRPRSGYHDTITVAFVRVIAPRLQADEPFPAFRARNPDLFDRTLPTLLRHYSSERLQSAEARQEFIEPDLEPLPV